jgi:PKD repeat protein
VRATNQAGLTTTARAATVFVDTVHPRVTIRLSGRRIVGVEQTIVVTRSDPPPPGAPTSAASGVASTQVSWGEGRRVAAGHLATHTYKRARTYTITATATDRAGNRTVVTRKLTIRPKPKPKPKKKKGKKRKKAAHRVTGSRR